jgi:hypothetical protein
VEAHSISSLFASGDRFDHYLLAAARRHRVTAGIADAYARVFLPASALRRKLVLLLAILETCPPSYRLIDDVVGGSRPVLLLRLAARAGAGVIGMFLGALVFVPARWALAVVGRRPR